MDGFQFDALLRTLLTTRRSLLGAALATGSLGSIGDRTAARKRKPCPPCRKRKKGKCKGHVANGTACPDGTCEGGQCVATPEPLTCADQCPATCGLCFNRAIGGAPICASIGFYACSESCSTDADCPGNGTFHCITSVTNRATEITTLTCGGTGVCASIGSC